MDQERWLPVLGYEGFYEISDHGRVRSAERTVPHGERTKQMRGRILKPWLSGGGSTQRYQIGLSDETGRRQRYYVHILVLEAFIGPRLPGFEACHLDDDGENNWLDNLRWDTRSANEQDKVRNGNHHNAKKTHCKNGHAFTVANTKFRPGGGRWCRECRRTSSREWARRNYVPRWLGSR